VGRSSTSLAHVPEPTIVPFDTPVGGRTVFCLLVVSSGGQISTFIPSIQIFDFYPIGRLPHLHFFFKVELKVNACYLRFSVR
jgi:hypothetical protein